MQLSMFSRMNFSSNSKSRSPVNMLGPAISAAMGQFPLSSA